MEDNDDMRDLLGILIGHIGYDPFFRVTVRGFREGYRRQAEVDHNGFSDARTDGREATDPARHSRN